MRWARLASSELTSTAERLSREVEKFLRDLRAEGDEAVQTAPFN